MTDLSKPVSPAPPAADTPAQPAPAAPADAPPAPAAPPVAAYTFDDALGLMLHGVPIIAPENPFGGAGLGHLVSLDLDASYEVGQKFTSPDTPDAEGRKLPHSGGAAYYVDHLTGKGWSVPLKPDEA